MAYQIKLTDSASRDLPALPRKDPMKEFELTDDLFQGIVSIQRTDDGYVKPWRLPCDRLSLFPPDEGALAARAETAAGVRVRFQTTSPRIGLSFAPVSESMAFDLTIDNKLIQTVTIDPGDYVAIFDDIPCGDKTVEIWLPQRNIVALRHLLADAPAAASPDRRKKWVTYGSSITHCGEAHSPARTWPACVARKHDLNLTCLGYGGHCVLEPMVAVMIRDLPADFISLKLGINVYGGALSPRTFEAAVIGLVQIIREKHPTIPIAVISPIISPPRETELNAVGLSLTIMRDQIQDAVRRLTDHGDGNLHYFNGLDLFGEDLVEDYLPDLCHPNGDGYELLAENFSNVVFSKIKLDD